MTGSLFAHEEENQQPVLDEESQTSQFDSEESVKDQPDRVDLGNHEADDVKEPPHINDEGHLVDSDGNKVFTTTEEAIKDGSFVLDSKGRMPGVYLEDIEQEERLRLAKKYEEAFEDASEIKNSVVERQVNVQSSPLPPVTVVSRQEPAVLEDDEPEPVNDEPVLDRELV